MGPAHRLIGRTVIAAIFDRFDAALPEKLARKPPFVKVEVIVHRPQADAAAKHVKAGSCGEGIARIEPRPRLTNEIGILQTGDEAETGQNAESLVAAVALDQLFAQPARMIGALQDQPFSIEANGPGARTEDELTREFAERRVPAAIEQGVLTVVDLHAFLLVAIRI